MSQDADTTLSGSSEHVPNSSARPSDSPGDHPGGGPGPRSSSGPAADAPGREDWAALAARLHDELVALLTRRPDAAADLAPALELAGRLRAEGERSLRWVAVHGPSAGSSASGESGPAAGGGAGGLWLELGLLDDFAAVPRDRRIRQSGRFERHPRAGAGRERRPAAAAAPPAGTPDAGDELPAIDRAIPPGLDDDAGRRFVVEGRSLHEYALDSDRPPVSVSHADYERIARAFASLSAPGPDGEPEPTQAKQLREATGDPERTAPLEPRLVSLTHVYICLRLWQAARLVGRQTGGWFVPLRLQTGGEATEEAFVGAALAVWRHLARAAEGVGGSAD